MMIEPKEIKIEIGGIEKTFVISKVPAIEGREIFSQYLTSAAPKVGDYSLNESLMRKLLKHVSVSVDGDNIPLNTEQLINNHIPSWECLVMLEKEMISYNCSFFRNGKTSDFLNELGMNLMSKITAMLTDLLDQSLQAENQRTEN